MTTEKVKRSGLEYGKAGERGGYDDCLKRLNHQLDRLPIKVAELLRHGSMLRTYGPGRAFAPEEDAGDDKDGRVAAYLIWAGELREHLDAVDELLKPFLLDFPHERMRDIEGMLDVIAEEHGMAEVLKLLRQAGARSVSDLSGLQIGVLYRACTEKLYPEPTDGFAEVTSAKSPADTPDRAQPARPRGAKPAPRRTVRDWPSYLNRQRDVVFSALSRLAELRGQHAVGQLIGVEQQHDGVLRTGTVFNRSNYDEARWKRIMLDADALADAADVADPLEDHE